MRRFKNFHKSKPIVQNVKTNSVNEGQAPKNLTLANDISDWNPGLSHDQINEAKGKGKSGAAANTTSYSASAETKIIKRDSKNKIEKSDKRIRDAKEKSVALDKVKDEASDQIEQLDKELSVGSDKLQQYDKEASQADEAITNIQQDIDKAEKTLKLAKAKNDAKEIARQEQYIEKYNVTKEEASKAKNDIAGKTKDLKNDIARSQKALSDQQQIIKKLTEILKH